MPYLFTHSPEVPELLVHSSLLCDRQIDYFHMFVIEFYFHEHSS
jgi:hypothetical protein